MSEFGWGSTTDEVLAGKDLSGRTVFITGANSGLGQETARAMAARGAEVIMAGRDQAKLDESVAAIRADHPKAQLETITVDLTSLEKIRAATSRAVICLRSDPSSMRKRLLNSPSRTLV